ncbi:hypothetical protein [Shinella sp.]|uniref:hypothetical protein n=1 Tax=Shinella sp. TaxID=1870904 RepID=UPI003F6FB22E
MSHQKDERGDPISRTHDPARKGFSAVEARQGGKGFPVLAVLGTSLALVVVVWAAVELWGNYIDPTPDRMERTTTTSGEPTQDTIDNSVPGETQTVPTDRDPTPESGTGGESQTVTPDGTSN